MWSWDCCPSYVYYPGPATWCCDPCWGCYWSCYPGCCVIQNPCCTPVQSVERAIPGTATPKATTGGQQHSTTVVASVLHPQDTGHDPSHGPGIAISTATAKAHTVAPMSDTTADGQARIRKSTGPTALDRAVLMATVPAEARVYINGLLTQSSGTHRRYFSQGLLTDRQYTFRFEVVVERDGQLLRDTQVVHVNAGDAVTLTFKPVHERIAQR